MLLNLFLKNYIKIHSELNQSLVQKPEHIKMRWDAELCKGQPYSAAAICWPTLSLFFMSFCQRTTWTTQLLVRVVVIVLVLPSHQQFKDQDAKRPKINCKVVSLVLDYLRSHVLRSANKWVGFLTTHQLLCKAKVNLHTDRHPPTNDM